MAHQCTRPGCSAPAAALLSFDPINCHVWIEHFGAAGGATDQPLAQVQALCAAHADRTTPPRGWTISVHRAVDPPTIAALPGSSDPPDDRAAVDDAPTVAADSRQRRRRPHSLLDRALSNVGNQRSVLTQLDDDR